MSGPEGKVLQQAKHKKTKSQLSFTTMNNQAIGDGSGPNGSIASSVAKNRIGAPSENQHNMLGKQPNFGPVHYHNNSGGVV